MGGSWLVLRVESEGGVRRVYAEGDIDLSNAGRLAAALCDGRVDSRVELNCRGVRFADASFVRVVVAADEARVADEPLVLVDPSPPVELLLGVLRLDRSLRTRDEASRP